MKVLMISSARDIFREGSRSHDRMKLYANALEELHIIVLTRKKHSNGKIIHDGNLHLYPTHSRSRIGMLVGAYRIGRQLIRASKIPVHITSQDPLEMGLVAYVLSKTQKSFLQIQVHGDYFNDFWVRESFFYGVRQKLARYILQKATQVRVVSKRIKSSLVSHGIEEKKITILPIRPELESFLSQNQKHNHSNPFTFLYVGRFAPEKDILRIITAFNMVAKEHGDVKLQLAGAGTEETVIRQKIKELHLEERTEIMSWTDDVAGLMNGADVLVLASKHESYAMVLIEAMAAGLPVVTTDVGCVGEIVKDGEHGLVVRDAGDEPYARAMMELIEGDEKRNLFAENGRKTVKGIASQTMEEYVEAWVTSMSSQV